MVTTVEELIDLTKEEANAKLGEWLFRVRELSGLSQEKVARRFDVSTKAYVSWEKGEVTPGGLTMLSILWGPTFAEVLEAHPELRIEAMRRYLGLAA